MRFTQCLFCDVTAKDENMESSDVGNTELTSDERKQLQQNIRYIAVINYY